MTTKATKTKAAPAPQANTIEAVQEPGDSREVTVAKLAVSPCFTGALTATTFSRAFGDVGLTETTDVLQKRAERVHGGDLREVETTLVAQAAALNAVFTDLARRAALNMGEYMGAVETYMRLALRAQNQCRMTLETLATIKNPPVVFAKQANIAHGHQQVNNGIPAHAGETEGAQTELSRLGHEQGQSLDGGAAAAAGGSHTAMATVEAIHRPAQHRGQGRIKP